MRNVLVAVFVVYCLSLVEGNLKCQNPRVNIPGAWLDMRKQCVKELKRQIQAEVDTSTTYTAMGCHFERDTINRPGFAKYFFDYAWDNREHAHKLIDYLVMRGQLSNSEITNLIVLNCPSKSTWASGEEALKDALRIESKITESIRRVIDVCKNDPEYDDYHLVEYLTTDYLEEQYHEERKLAGKASALGKMMCAHGALGEFLYDKRL